MSNSNLPVLVMASDYIHAQHWARMSKFKRHEWKYIKSGVELRGYKDKHLFLVNGKALPIYDVMYCKENNITTAYA